MGSDRSGGVERGIGEWCGSRFGSPKRKGVRRTPPRIAEEDGGFHIGGGVLDGRWQGRRVSGPSNAPVPFEESAPFFRQNEGKIDVVLVGTRTHPPRALVFRRFLSGYIPFLIEVGRTSDPTVWKIPSFSTPRSTGGYRRSPRPRPRRPPPPFAPTSILPRTRGRGERRNRTAGWRERENLLDKRR